MRKLRMHSGMRNLFVIVSIFTFLGILALNSEELNATPMYQEVDTIEKDKIVNMSKKYGVSEEKAHNVYKKIINNELLDSEKIGLKPIRTTNIEKKDEKTTINEYQDGSLSVSTLLSPTQTCRTGTGYTYCTYAKISYRNSYMDEVSFRIDYNVTKNSYAQITKIYTTGYVVDFANGLRYYYNNPRFNINIPKGSHAVATFSYDGYFPLQRVSQYLKVDISLTGYVKIYHKIFGEAEYARP